MKGMKSDVIEQSGDERSDLEAAELSKLELAELSAPDLQKVGGGQSTAAVLD